MTRIVKAADRDALARLLADEVATVLEGAIRCTGRTALAVPGGTTPAAFLSALGGHALDWGAVAVTLTDERCVRADHSRSNRRLLDETLLPVDDALHSCPALSFNEDMMKNIRNGHPVSLPQLSAQEMVRIYDASGVFFGIGTVMEDGRMAIKRLN